MLYRIEQSNTTWGITYSIRAYLADGWKLHGGVVVSVDPITGNITFYQALIKEDQ